MIKSLVTVVQQFGEIDLNCCLVKGLGHWGKPGFDIDLELNMTAN